MSQFEAIIVLILIICLVGYLAIAMWTNDTTYDEYTESCKRDNVDLW